MKLLWRQACQILGRDKWKYRTKTGKILNFATEQIFNRSLNFKPFPPLKFGLNHLSLRQVPVARIIYTKFDQAIYLWKMGLTFKKLTPHINFNNLQPEENFFIVKIFERSR